VKEWLYNSIAAKMTLLVLGGSFLVLSVVLGYSYYYSRGIILAETELAAKNLTLSVASRIEQEFRALEKLPKGVAQYLECDPGDKGTLSKLIGRVVNDNQEIFGSAVAFEPDAFEKGIKAYCPYYFKGPTGLRFEQLANPSYDYFCKDWYYIPKVLKAPVWSEPYFDEGGANIIMCTYSVPFFEMTEHREHIRGVVTADVSLEWLTKLVSSLDVTHGGFCFIISDTGIFVTSPRPEHIMRESMFSLAEERNDPQLRAVGKAMLRNQAGFVEIGPSLTGRNAFLAYARIPSPGWSLAAVFPRDEIFAEVQRLYVASILLAVVGVMMLLGVSILVARSMARPLRAMAVAAGRVARGDLEIDLSHIRSKDEIGQLAGAFTSMTAGLQERDRIRDTFGRYLTKEVVNKLLESKDGLKLGGERREITMIMSDLRGFTALTSNMTPEEVISFLNRYLGKMVEILVEYHGIVDEIIGDGILAFFGAPEPLEDHPARGVACALKMQAGMEEVNALHEAEGLPRLEMSVAVNTGHVVVGNIGSEKRAKYGAVGSEVNFTGRMESFAVGGQVLVSPRTYDRLKDILDVRDVLQVEMKGVSGKVALYDVRGIRGAYNVVISDRSDTLVPLKWRIPAAIHRVDKKIVTGAQTIAWFVEASSVSGKLAVPEELRRWEDLRIVLLDADQHPTGGVLYAKVVSVDATDEGSLATVRFTSVSTAAAKALKAAMGEPYAGLESHEPGS